MLAGTNEATACVTIWNAGEDAYRPHEFGPTIEIERRISDRGGSTFKLKSSQGKTVATGQNELKQLLTHFQIDACNPVVCLTQVQSWLASAPSHFSQAMASQCPLTFLFYACMWVWGGEEPWLNRIVQ